MNFAQALLFNWRMKNARKKLDKAIVFVERHGLTVCEIVHRAGTDYIRDKDGSLHMIGRADKKAPKPANKQIAKALKRGEDATGLGTVRDAVSLMEESNHNPMEMCFNLNGTKYNVMIEIIGRNGLRSKGTS